MPRGYNQPFGDIYSAQTPMLNRTMFMLYNQEQQRQQRAQQASLEMDSNLQRQLGNVKNVDVPEIMDAWSKYKDATIAQYRNPNMSGKDLAAAQIQQRAALADFNQRVNESRMQRETHEAMFKDYNKNSNNYEDDAPTLLTEAMNTKSPELKNKTVNREGQIFSLDNPNAYRFLGANADLNPVYKVAEGQINPTGIKSEPVSDIQNRITQYEYGNSPGAYYNSLVGSFASQPKFSKVAAKLYGNIPDEHIQQVDRDYNAITPDKWLAMTGSTQPQPIPEGNTPQEKYAAYQTKVRAINASVRIKGTRDEYDIKKRIAFKDMLDTDRQKLILGLREGRIDARMYKREAFKNANASDIDNVVNYTYNQLMGSAEPVADPTGLGGTGKTFYQLPVDGITQDIFPTTTREGYKIKPTGIVIDPKDNQAILQYSYTAKEKNDKGQDVDKDEFKTEKIPIYLFKVRLGKFFGGSETSKFVKSEMRGGTVPAAHEKPIAVPHNLKGLAD